MSRLLELEDCKLLGGSFRNFSGKESKFNPNGDKSVCVLIPDEMVDKLIEDGWNVKYTKPRNEEDIPKPYINVAISYKFAEMAPKIYRVVEGNAPFLLDNDTVGQLDYDDIQRVDLSINPRYWENDFGQKGIKAYCKTMFVTVQEETFTSRYFNNNVDDDIEPFA